MSPEHRIPADHDELQALCAGHALGCLDPPDSIRLLAHLREGCPLCEREIAEHDETVASLAQALDPVSPPPSAESEFLRRIGEDSVSEPIPRAAPPGWRYHLLPAAAALLAAASLWLAWSTQQQSARLVQENLVLHEAVDAIPRSSVRVYPLLGGASGASGWVVVEPGASGTADRVLVHATMPAPPAGSGYHAWIRIGPEVHAIGRVELDGDGYGFARSSFRLDAPIAGVLITQETQVRPESPLGPVIMEYRREAAE